MGGHAEYTAMKAGVSREDADGFALHSHQKACAAIRDGFFQDEIIPVEIKRRSGVVVVDTDESPRETTSLEALGALRPAFTREAPAEIKEHVVTAGNAPGLNDGAAAVVVTSLEYAKAHGLEIDALVSAYTSGATQPQDIFFAPIVAVKQLSEIQGTSVQDYELVELNEAFSVQAIANIRGLKLNADRVNVHGGAVALGHPIGASGTRIVVTLLRAMEQRDAAMGLATLCLGGGNAVALSVEKI
jgi:acetyl-CoA C-acetyltransferase